MYRLPADRGLAMKTDGMHEVRLPDGFTVVDLYADVSAALAPHDLTLNTLTAGAWRWDDDDGTVTLRVAAQATTRSGRSRPWKGHLVLTDEYIADCRDNMQGERKSLASDIAREMSR